VIVPDHLPDGTSELLLGERDMPYDPARVSRREFSLADVRTPVMATGAIVSSRALLVAVVLLGEIAARANELSAGKAAEALRLCEEASRASWMNQPAAMTPLDDAVLLAEAAVAADDTDPHAHLALFCTLDHQFQIAGLSWRSFSRLQRIRREIERASALAPDDPDILVARGGFLCRIPRPLGGDSALGEKLLLRALELRPDHVVGRLDLAKSLAARHAPEARARAYGALALAKRQHATRQEIEAEELLASLRD
jgi:hypothetical protein